MCSVLGLWKHNKNAYHQVHNGRAMYTTEYVLYGVIIFCVFSVFICLHMELLTMEMVKTSE